MQVTVHTSFIFSKCWITGLQHCCQCHFFTSSTSINTTKKNYTTELVFISIDLLFVEMRTPYKVVYGIKFGYHLTPCFTISPISTTWLDIFLVQKYIFCVFLVVKVVKLLLNVWIRSFIRQNCVAMLLDQLILYLLKWTDRMRDKSGSRWWILKISVRALVVFQSWLNHCGYKGTAFDVAIWPSPDALTHMVHIHLVQNFRGCCLLNSYIVI